MKQIDTIKASLNKHLSPSQQVMASLCFILVLIILVMPDSQPQGIILNAEVINSSVEPILNTQTDIPAEIKSTHTIRPLIKEQVKEDTRFFTQVKSGDNLSVLFSRAGLSPQLVYKISNSGPEANILSKLYPGYKLAFDISDSGELNELEVIKTPLDSYLFTQNEQNNFEIEHIIRTPDIEHAFKQASVQDSLFLAAQKGGISAPLTMEIAGIFSGVIDFMLDTRTGDSFNVLYEEKHINNEFVENGAIQAAQFTNQGETFTALRYVNNEGEAAYYNLAGESMRKAFLLNPVDFTRISSGFNPSRKHPILNTIRAHKGTDYAAPRGTPVVATSDGRITWAARKGSFGKLVVIQHGDQFQTKYAHLSDYARGIKNGARVQQGQIIGYIGTTGSATGPHLHYEFLMNGVHRNSRTIHSKLPKAKAISEEEMPRFLQQTQILMARLDSFTSATPSLAQNTQAPTKTE